MTDQRKVDFLVECAIARDTERTLAAIGDDIGLLVDAISYCVSQGGRYKRHGQWLRQTYAESQMARRKAKA